MTLFLQRGSLVVCGAGLLAGLLALTPAARPRPQQYDDAEALAKLQRIGRSLALYRQEYGHKAVDQWETPADAGLPPSLDVLLRPGHSWTLAGGWGDLRAVEIGIDKAGTFLQGFPWPSDRRGENWDEPYEDWSTEARRLGHGLPVVIDALCGHRAGMIAQGPRDCRYLRWDGTVATQSTGAETGGTGFTKLIEEDR